MSHGEFTVVAADLRGYGDSSKPADGVNHSGYSKRAMAQDQVEVMRHFGFDRFAVVGHDRGGRVTHRMLLDHSDRITKAAVIDIVPTHKVYHNVTKELATAYYHWFFLIRRLHFRNGCRFRVPESFVRQGSSTPAATPSTSAVSAIRPPFMRLARTTAPAPPWFSNMTRPT